MVLNESQSISVKSVDLEKLLLSFIEGQIIIKFYEKRNILDEAKRRKLTELVVTQFMFQKSADEKDIIRLSNADFDILSQKINYLFPNEQQAFYYVPPKSEGPTQKISKGKLPDFYRNKLDECRQLGLIQRKRKKIDENIDLDTEPTFSSKAKRICQTHLQWLRYNTAPWSSVKEHWDGSRELRQSFIKQYEGNVHDIFNEFPVLKQEFGYMLTWEFELHSLRRKCGLYKITGLNKIM
ncbi:PREDICTED: uncharacterized protein LOC105461364 [Wasmannia auropunctata]|uniref:uncharacterized protein LOC105461364 n=1 Tax=Wasmannia auropunctata TaxID=64793 RepID=UPI0005EEE39C|nr:PREDICTED: uncharacterized protein LOC105461364 [Wasmannia auropunctata]